jgi:Tfp pilus assembly protein PilO
VKEQPGTNRGGISREQLRARFTRFKFSRQHGVLGPAEIIGLVGSTLVLVLMIVSYLYFLVPARSRLNNLQLERSRLQTQLKDSQNVVRQEQSTDATVQNITKSLDEFESGRLNVANSGRMSLYDSLNQLMRKNALRNTSGPTYTTLEPKGLKPGASGTKSGNTKWQSIYPGIAISVTVEGQYQNLRRFVRDIEANRQFVIINSVELERATETNGAPSVEGETPTSGAGGALVSLRLEMATYFQRESGATPSGPVTR